MPLITKAALFFGVKRRAAKIHVSIIGSKGGAFAHEAKDEYI